MSGNDPPHDRLAFVASLAFVARHGGILAVLCLGAALGRYAQVAYPVLGTTGVNLLLELLVEGARVAIALLVIGAGSLKEGVRRIRDFFRLPEAERNVRFAGTKARLQTRWPSLVIDFAIFLGVAIALNLAIAAVAPSAAMTRVVGFLHGDADSESARVLLLKNLTVIPLTIIFQVNFFARVFLRPTTGVARVRQ